jgi:glyceraldehyde-3-phosphate dehydrogenase (ferredoxin)
MGGAALVFNNLGIDTLSIVRKAPAPSILYLNRVHGEEIQLKIVPVDIERIWREGRGGVYGLMDHAYERFGEDYIDDPRILAVGPASRATDFGAVVSVPIRKGKLTFVDTWAGRGGFGSKLLQEHGIAAIIYGGTHLEEDFRDRKVADQWFINKYDQKMNAKDLDATIKYRYDEKFNTGGTFGVNYTKLAGRMLSFNYQSIYMDEEDRLDLHKDFVLDHYLKQFNEETIAAKQQKNCGEPCVAVCKKMNGEFKKDYEPYQTMGPLSGIFDQRAAELLNHHADMLGFDAISIGGVIAWLMECLDKKYLKPEELGVTELPVFRAQDFDLVGDSMNNARIGIELLDGIVERRGLLDLSEGARKLARHLARTHGQKVLDSFLYTAYARKGWMVPNQYWTPGVLSPMPIMGKYYMYYGYEFVSPRELGRVNADRMTRELILDNLGFCRFHRGWAEEMLPDIVGTLTGMKEEFLAAVKITASRISSRNSSIFWESERNMDYIHTFLKRERDVEGNTAQELMQWLDAFDRDKKEASITWWYEMHKGVHETLREY